MLGWALVAGAAELQVELTLPAQPGAPASGYTGAILRLPEAVRPPESVTTELSGFTLTCEARGRIAEIQLDYELQAFPEHPPAELQCVVGGHTLTAHVRHDLALVAPKAHPSVRAGFLLTSLHLEGQHPDQRGRLVDATGAPVEGVSCGVEQNQLELERHKRAPSPQPGLYRCLLVDGQEVPVEILPLAGER